MPITALPGLFDFLPSQCHQSTLDYLKRLTERSRAWKLVRCGEVTFNLREDEHGNRRKTPVQVTETESWHPSWLIANDEWFLVTVSGGVHTETGTFYLWLCGLDDLGMESRGLTKTRAMEIFNQIEDGMTREELAFFFGLTYF